MTALLLNPFATFHDQLGHPLDQGYIYVGEANKDPKQFPIDVYLDVAKTNLAIQPLRTINGTVNNGYKPIPIFTDAENYSVLVLDKNEVQVFYDKSSVTSNFGVTGALEYIKELTDTAREDVMNQGFVARIYDTAQAGVAAGTGVPTGAYYNVRSSTPNIYADEYLNNNGIPQATGKTYPTLQAWADALATVTATGDAKIADVAAMGELKKAQLSEIAAAVSGLNSGLEFYETQTALLASVPTFPKKAAKALDTKKVWFWNGSGWVDTGLSELDQANARMDANPLFKPVTLTTETITNIVTSGNYLQSSSANATIARGYPEQITGKLTVIGVGNYVFYTYETTTRNRYSGVLSGGSFSGWTLVSAPDFFAYRGGLSTANLNTRITQGWFVQSNSANSTLVNNYPVVAAGRLDVFAVSATSLIWQRFTTITNVVYMRAYNGSTWSAWVQLATTAEVSAAQTTAQTTAIAYTDSQALNLFGKNSTNLFAAANLIVRRYLTTGVPNDYAAGTYQTAVGGGLSVAVTASGSGAITHYLRTALFNYTTVSGTFLINTINAPGNGEGCGVGCIDASGNYIAYIYTESGNVRKISNQTSTVIASGLATYTVGDTIKISITSKTLTVLKNGTSVHTSTIAAPLVNEILIGQSGFVRYTVAVDIASDPIRDYVTEKTASLATDRAPIYYSFNPTGGSSSAGLMTVYSQIRLDKYVGFEIGHEVDATDLVYVNYWRIVKAKIYTLSTNGVMVDTGKFALGEGESEFVFKQNSTKDDFTGGVHGDEQITDIKFMADGITLSTASTIALTAAKTFEYFAKSTMHETAEGGVFIAGHPVIANHIKRTSFISGGYKTFNRITWSIAATISTVYHGISCTHKDVASSVMTDGTFTAQAMTGSNTLYFNEVGSRQAISSNSANGLSASASATLLKPTADDATSLLFVQDRTLDSKYYRKSPARAVTSGEVMECEFTCQFFTLVT